MKRNSLSLLVCCAATIVGLGTAAQGRAQSLAPAAPGAAAPPAWTEPSVLQEAANASAPSSNPTVWADVEYLLWWVKGASLPPLVTTGPVTNPVVAPGVLGQPGTSVALGGDRQNLDGLSGGRFTVGAALDSEQTAAVAASYFGLVQKSTTRGVASPGNPALSVPFLNVKTGAESSSALANIFGFTDGAGTFVGGGFPGSATATTSTQLQGAELNALINLGAAGPLRLSVLGGFRWAQLYEKLDFDTNSSLSGFPFLTDDEFKTQNDFFGGQLGVSGEYQMGKWYVQGTGKAAIGDLHQTIRINGSLETNTLPRGLINVASPLLLTTFPGGYFTGPGNIGTFHRDRFGVLPEVNLTIGYQVSERTRIFAGYSYLYLSDVARPGDQVDRSVNPTNSAPISSLAPTATAPLRPTFLGKDSDFWAQGLNLGVTFGF